MPKKEMNPEEKVREMLKTGEGWEDFKEKLTNVAVKCELQPLAEGKKREILLNTGTVLDDLFGGGLSAGQTVELYGEFASGKSQACFTFIVEAASSGFVIVIDAEDTFSRRRILQIAKARGKDITTINNNLMLYKPENWQQQVAVPASIDPDLPVKLIIVDSLMALFRSTPEFAGRQNLGKRQELIRWHLRQFKRIAKRHGAIIVYTNQVYDSPVANPFMPKWACQHPVGGHSVAHIGDYRIFLRKASGNVRIARLVDSSEIAPAERVFQINERGIDDLSEEQREEAIKKEKKFANRQQAGQLVKKRKKTKKELKEMIKSGVKVHDDGHLREEEEKSDGTVQTEQENKEGA